MNLFINLHYNINEYYVYRNWLLNKQNNWIVVPRTKDFGEISKGIQDNSIMAVNKLYDWCNQNKIKMYFMIVPDKETVYSEKANMYYHSEIVPYAQVISRTKENLSLKVVYPLEDLITGSLKDYVFFKTDHHWTEWGAYIGYQALMKEIQQDFADVKVVQEEDYNIFYEKKVRSDFNRNFHSGQTLSALNLKHLSKEHFLDTKYKYYTPKENINEKRIDESRYRQRDYYNENGSNYRVLLTGNSMNENLQQFLPYSFKHLKYLRLNSVKDVKYDDEFKLMKRYQQDILNYKPNILILCVSITVFHNLPNLFKN